VEVPWEELTKGYEYEKDQYVEITDEDLEKADVEFSKTIQIEEFVHEEEIDPVYFDKPYYLEPQKGGERAYALMREALGQSKRVGIARVVIKTREHLAAVKTVGNMMTLQTMRFAHEIVDAGDLNLPAIEPTQKEMDLANTLIESMADKFDAKKYKDQYHDKVMELINLKIQGVTPAAPARPKVPGKVVDLMEILKQSLEETQTKKRSPAPAAPPAEEETVVAGGDGRKTTKPAGRTRKAR
jgi:DNA end-binding protein Ku